MRLFTRRAALTGALVFVLAPAASAQFFRANLSGASEVPPNASTATGAAIGYLSGSQFTMAGGFRGLGSNYLASHIHLAPAGSNGPIAVGLSPTVDGDQRGGRWEPATHSFALTGDQVSALTAGNLYINVHSATLGGGEIRGQLQGSVVIHELRIDQTGTDNDEYVEIAGPAGTSLTGMTYLVIGDGSTTGTGTIEYVISFDGQTIPADGIWLGGGGDDMDNMVLGVPVDFQFDPNFENSDAVTHLLVTGFTGANGDDLDTDDNGTLDSTPWGTIIDAIGFADDTTPDFPYGAFLGFVDLPANGTFPFAHGFRDGATGEWRGGQFEPVGGQDTPGAPNAIVVANEPGVPANSLTLEVDANPAHNHVGVRFSLPEAAGARIALYDITGREVMVVTDGARPAGTSTVVVDAGALAPGVYVLRLTAGGAQASRTLTVAR